MPVLSASLAPTACRKVIVELPLDTGPGPRVRRDLHPQRLRQRERAVGIRRPGSDTVSAASPAVEVTFAVVVAVYSRATPGVNAGNVAALPSVSASVAGTVPPTVVEATGPGGASPAKSPAECTIRPPTIVRSDVRSLIWSSGTVK